MAAGKNQYRVLVAGGNDRICDSVGAILAGPDYGPIQRAESAGQTRRRCLEEMPDILIIFSPLRDEFGTRLALDMAEQNVGVLLLVPGEAYEQVCAKVEDYGVLTLAKPMSRQSFYSAVKLLTATRARLMQMERKYRALQEKMQDIRTVNRAKWLLIEHLHLTEDEAHHVIEKQAMDLRISRREAAERIIEAYQ